MHLKPRQWGAGAGRSTTRDAAHVTERGSVAPVFFASFLPAIDSRQYRFDEYIAVHACANACARTGRHPGLQNL
jgi:hypothetical protein